MTPTNLRLVKHSEISSATRDVRYRDPRTSSWAETQAWVFDEGDAIVVVAGHLPDVHTYVVLRLGSVVRVVEAMGLVAACQGFAPPVEPACSHCDDLLEFQDNCPACTETQ